MNEIAGAPSYTYVVPEPFERALKLIREALEKEGLEIPVELDVSGRIRKKLGISLAPCRLLCVDSAMTLVETVAIDTAGALYLPLRLVVAGRGPQTTLHLMSLNALQRFEAPPAVKIPVGKLQARLSRVLQRIGSRQALSAG
ncbi:MAG: hypothetical protein ACUVXB_15010 [Bryobacteraceae bacterium]